MTRVCWIRGAGKDQTIFDEARRALLGHSWVGQVSRAAAATEIPIVGGIRPPKFSAGAGASKVNQIQRATKELSKSRGVEWAGMDGESHCVRTACVLDENPARCPVTPTFRGGTSTPFLGVVGTGLVLRLALVGIPTISHGDRAGSRASMTPPMYVRCVLEVKGCYQKCKECINARESSMEAQLDCRRTRVDNRFGSVPPVCAL